MKIDNDEEPVRPEVWKLQFLTDVTTAAGLVEHGKRDKGLALRIGEAASRWRFELFATTPAEPAGWLHTLDNTEGLKGNEPERELSFDRQSPFGRPGIDHSKSYQVISQPLYAEPQPRKGWKLVPVEPTDAMATAAIKASLAWPGLNGAHVWAAMLAAAPATP